MVDDPHFLIQLTSSRSCAPSEMVARERSYSTLRLLITPVWLSAPAGTSQPDGSGSATKAAVASTISTD